jgi:hypothetical protein
MSVKKATSAKPKKSKKSVDKTSDAPVQSAPSTDASQNDALSQTSEATSQTQESKVMNLSLVRNDKQRKSNAVTYNVAGYAGSVRFSKSFFADKTGPASFTLDSDQFGEPRKTRATMTAEERKAARANAPKLTPAEKLAKIEERAAKLRAKIAATQS